MIQGKLIARKFFRAVHQMLSVKHKAVPMFRRDVLSLQLAQLGYARPPLLIGVYNYCANNFRWLRCRNPRLIHGNKSHKLPRRQVGSPKAEELGAAHRSTLGTQSLTNEAMKSYAVSVATASTASTSARTVPSSS